MIIKPGKGERTPTTLVICVNNRFSSDQASCAGRGSESLADELEARIKDLGVQLTVERIRCFGMCAEGPNMRLYPDGAFFTGVKPADLPEIIRIAERMCARKPKAEDGGLQRLYPGA